MTCKGKRKSSKGKRYHTADANKELKDCSTSKRFSVPLLVTLCMIGGIVTALSFSVRIVVADYDAALKLSGTASSFFVSIAKLVQNLDGYSFAGAAVAGVCAVFAAVNVISLSMSYLKNWDFVFGNRYQFFLPLPEWQDTALFFMP